MIKTTFLKYEKKTISNKIESCPLNKIFFISNAIFIAIINTNSTYIRSTSKSFADKYKNNKMKALKIDKNDTALCYLTTNGFNICK